MSTEATETKKTEAKKTEAKAADVRPVVKMSLLNNAKDNRMVRDMFYFALKKKGSNLTEVCKFIKKNLDKAVGPSWQCIIGKDLDITARYHTNEGIIIVDENNPKKKDPREQLTLVAFRAAALASPEPPASKEEKHPSPEELKALIKKTRLLNTGLTSAQQKKCVEQWCICGAEFEDDTRGMLIQLRSRLSALYGPTWHFFASVDKVHYAITTEESNEKFFEVRGNGLHALGFQYAQEKPPNKSTWMCGLLKRPSLSTIPLYGYLLAGLFFLVYANLFGTLCKDADGQLLPEQPFYCSVPEDVWGLMAFGTFIICYVWRMGTRTVTKVKRKSL